MNTGKKPSIFQHINNDSLCALSPTTAVQNGVEAKIPPAEDIGPAHLLIVDDDLAGIGLIVNYLRDYDFAVSTCDEGAEAVQLIHELRPDLILLDLCMSGTDGFSVLRALRSQTGTRSIPVVMLTARKDTASKVEGFRLGVTDYLTKPVDQGELLARITAHLHRSRLQYNLEARLRKFQQRFGEPQEWNSAGEPSDNATRQEVQTLRQARRILRERLDAPPSLTELARMVGTNQPRLSKGFRLLFGTTVYGFLREERLRRAREMLLHTRLAVKAVALEVGYRNTSDLSRAFKERFGISPSEARDGFPS